MSAYRIPEIAKKYVEYDMIRDHTELPAFPDSRAHLLYTLLLDGKLPRERSELYALVVWLVQLGLDTHDLVDNRSGPQPRREMRARQLLVLAGNYFSSRFYHLLSQAGQIEMIRRISSAVCEVNRLKMSLYARMKQRKVTADEYIGIHTRLRTGLFELFENLVDERVQAIYPDLLHGFTRCEVVMEELKRIESPGRFEGSWGYWLILQDGTEEERRKLTQHPREEGLIRQLVAKYNLTARLTELLRQSVAQVQSVLRMLESDRLAAELAQIAGKFLPSFTMQPAVTNETR
ncbi:MAG: heptaprenyl diphosphate synthase [Thermobacillus sp. ZCTH02-B1]|uniref:heptaprenyl diphosphate synthase component 1 n=1 Tax=Thermobacillus sp. ZCTH02-B1 TaxID=1858795 RepID=UPI000B577BC7|nr:heptaprenyl diphosphate synthase component 1 [Thermobacillus sp. ZCTH02-B1]OUM96790.1 MAG: heptaprenyl diphosphate synthase [Thermobacillus sp. ZCTH02-B1]